MPAVTRDSFQMEILYMKKDKQIFGKSTLIREEKKAADEDTNSSSMSIMFKRMVSA